MKFFICQHCKNMVAYLYKDKCNVRCCGEEMVELVPNTTDGAKEKHVPVLARDGSTVTVSVTPGVVVVVLPPLSLTVTCLLSPWVPVFAWVVLSVRVSVLP